MTRARLCAVRAIVLVARFFALCVVMACIVSGCRVGPEYTPPKPALPAAFVEGTWDTGQIDLAYWWRAFEDRVLDSLIERALAESLDLQAAAARIREARALRGVVAPDAWPQFDASGSYTRSRRSENARFGGGGTGVAGAGGGFSGDLDQDLYEAGFDASWELDLFGGVRRSVEAAAAEVGAAEEDARAVRVTLVAEVARNYVEMCALARRRTIAENNVRTQGATLSLTRARFDAGIATALDMARAEAEVESTRAAIPALDGAARQAMHRLAVLLGLHAGALVEELSTADEMPAAAPRMPQAVPLDLLARRPDLRRAERTLAAAVARIGVAGAEYYPRLTLTGTLGLRSEEIGDFARGDSHFLSVGPQVRWRLFDRRRIGAEVGVAEARAEQARIAFEQVLLDALSEVEDALAMLERERARQASLTRAAEAKRRAVDLATVLHEKGLTDFLDVLDAQRGLLATEDEVARSELAIAQQLIALCKALGGGWELAEPRQEAVAGFGRPKVRTE